MKIIDKLREKLIIVLAGKRVVIVNAEIIGEINLTEEGLGIEGQVKTSSKPFFKKNKIWKKSKMV